MDENTRVVEELTLFKDYKDDSCSLEKLNKISPMNANDLDSYRRSLLAQYRKKHKGILEKIKDGRQITADELMNIIVEDLLEESENFFGNSLIFTEDGNLRDATAIALKRTDLLKMVADILAKKRELSQRDSEIDLNSPAFMIFQKMCFDKMMHVLKELGLDNELIQLALSKWSQSMQDWGKELKATLRDMQ